MVTIKALLQDDLIIEEIEATDKMGVLREFARRLKSTGRIQNEEELVRVLAERESLGSTGIGNGIAIPHGKMNNIPEMIVAFGRSNRGVEYNSLDQQPVHLFFLIVTPDGRQGDHLKTLARVSRILKNPVLRDDLRKASQRSELQRLIFEEDGKYPQPQPLPHK
jgi:PTS system nitrogen regulatory IIA component